MTIPRLLLLALAYWVAHRLGYLLRVPPLNLAVVWPASGVALGLLLVTPPTQRLRLALALAATNLLAGFQAGLSVGYPIHVAFAFLPASVLEAGIGLLVFGATRTATVTLGTSSQVGALIAVATLGNAVSAVLGAQAQSFVLDRPFLRSYIVWWSANGLSLLLVTPAVVVLVNTLRGVGGGTQWRRRVE